MELKCSKQTAGQQTAGRSNRTFMELKYSFVRQKYEQLGVLIAPLWN